MNYKDIVAEVNKVVYYNAQSRWGVLSVNTEKVLDGFETNLITLSGNFEGVYEDCKIEFSGNLSVHPKYGKQIQITVLRVLQNTDSKESIINFLSKSAIKGIQIQNAKKIYDKFKEDSINIVLNETWKIKEITGIGEKTYKKVMDSVQNYRRIQDLLEYGTKLGIPYKVLYHLDKELGDRALSTLQNDIYSIVNKVDSISFKQVDDIALKSGYSPDNLDRLLAGFNYYLKNTLSLEGSTGISAPSFLKVFLKELGLTDNSLFYVAMNNLEQQEAIIVRSNIIYSRYYYDAEMFIATVINNMMSSDTGSFELYDDVKEIAINSFPFKLNKQQIKAIEACCNNRFNIITGPPGCGKSSITKAIVDIYENCGYNVILLSPTGKATRRLSECTGHDAQTIHKFLKVKSSIEDAQVIDLPENCLLIVDESSMMDVVLFSKLIACVKSSTRLIIVGDNDQLPSVQAGNVLGDLIEALPQATSLLTDIMRQAENSNIIRLCSYVNQGKNFDECEYPDFVFNQYDDEDKLMKDLVITYGNEVKNYGLSNVQVLTAYKRGKIGSINLNKVLSNYINKNIPNEDFGYKLEDKVIQLVNNYDYDIFNGETGIVTEFTDDNEMIVQYDDKRVIYPIEESDQITLANVITVHKSQGSEYPVIFMVLDDSSNFLLIRKILYTGISRGKQKVYIYSKLGLVSRCIQNNYYKKRITNLKNFIEVPVNV